MSIVTPYIESLEQLKADIPLIASEIVEKNAEKIILILQNKQLGLGLDSFGQPLSFTQGKYSGDGFYTEATEIIAAKESTRKPKIAGQHYNFQWSSSTFDSMFLKTDDGGQYEIMTRDGKQRMLEAIYGEIFDMTPEHNNFINETIIKPQLYQHLLENLFKF